MTGLSLAALALITAAAVTTKFTAVLLAPAGATLLVLRAMMPQPWALSGKRVLTTRGQRMLAAMAVSAICAITVFSGIWAAYGFQRGFNPDPNIAPDFQRKVRGAIASEILGRTGAAPTEKELASSRPGLAIRTASWAHSDHVLPDPFLYGMLSAYATSQYHWSYVLGDVTGQGYWYYFPVAILTKTPLATLAGIVFAIGLIVVSSQVRTSMDFAGGAWLWACLFVPPAFVLAVAIPSHLNIGLRHVFEIYPPVFVAIGVVASRMYAKRPKMVRNIVILLAIGLAAESLAAYPNYISFFNVAAGGARGGLAILSDSNLDWGQDLPLLAAWQREHPDRALPGLFWNL